MGLHSFGVTARSQRLTGTRSRATLVPVLPALALFLGACGLGGQPYPDRNITIVVPFAAGGPTDTVTRLVAEPMSTELGQTIVIENLAGAGGTTAAADVAASEADGYRILMHHIGMSTAPSLYADLEYDPLEDFELIGLVTEVPMTIIGAPEFEPNTMEELAEYVTANADTVNYANAGVGAASHLCGLLIQSALGVTVTEVPFDGTGPALAALQGNQVDFMCDQTTNTTGPIQDGAVKAYAVTATERLDTLPDLPTTAEAGFPDIEVTVWHGLYAPAGTPDDVVQRLTEALQAALTDETVSDRFAELGTTPVSQEQATSDAHREKLESELDRWRPIIEAADLPEA